MVRGSRRLLVVLGLFAAACLDPLYEDGAPLTSSWVVCCQRNTINTCFCENETNCAQAYFACAGGTCATTPQCIIEPTGGGSGTTDAGSSAGGSGASGGGAATGGGSATSDGGIGGGGGTGSDAGAGGGTATGGGGGTPTGGGTATSTGYEYCCVNSRVTTCACPIQGCLAEPFTPCRNATCVTGTTQAICR